MKLFNFTFTKKLYRKKTVTSIQKRINLLGINNEYNALEFMNLRVITTGVLFIVCLLFMNYGYILAPIISIMYYTLLPVVLIETKIKKRGRKLENEAMYFFEILTLSLESGRNLQTALEITSSNIDSELSEEVKYALQEVKYGRNLDEGLENMNARIPSDTINNIILNIRESNIFGNNIVETLYNQIDYIRDKRTMKIKEMINKIPLKVSVISVVFFIPLILLVLLAPVIVEYFIS